MARFRWHVPVVLSVVVLAAADAAAQTPRAWPCDLHVIGELRPFAEQAWAHSATFREQCWKLAAARAFVIVDAASSDEIWRADTHGVKFLMESRRRGARVSLNGGAYETQRAIDAGRRIGQEVRDALIEAGGASP